MTNAGAAGQAAPAPYYVVFDVDVRDAPRYGEYMAHVLPQIEAAGGKYLARGGPHTVYEGDWSPYRLVLLEFPSREAFEGFYHGPESAVPGQGGATEPGGTQNPGAEQTRRGSGRVTWLSRPRCPSTCTDDAAARAPGTIQITERKQEMPCQPSAE